MTKSAHKQRQLPSSRLILTNPGVGELTPAEMLNPVVVYESPNTKRYLVDPQVNLPKVGTASKATTEAILIPSILNQDLKMGGQQTEGIVNILYQ